MENRLGRLRPGAAWVAFVASLLAGTGAGALGARSEPVVPGYQRLKEAETAGGGEAAAGELLLSELNCTACHAAAGPESRVAPKGAPDLANIGNRTTTEWLRVYLSDPHGTMPDIFHASEPQARDGAVDFLVHFLASRGGPLAPATVESNDLQVDQGRQLFHSVGCVACHAPDDKPKSTTGIGAPAPAAAAGDSPGASPTARATSAAPDVPSVPLGNLAAKTTVDRLTVFLFDPLKTRPHGRMPAMGLNAAEAQAIAVYLLRDQLNDPKIASAPPPRSQGLRYAYYRREGDAVKDIRLQTLEALKPTAEGRVDRVGLSIPGRANDGFALKFSGILHVPRDGKYTFTLFSDDGSMLYLDGELLIDHGGVHGGTAKHGSIDLKAGDHSVAVTYFEEAGGEELRLGWEGPGVERQEVPPSALSNVGGRVMQPPGAGAKFTVDAQKAQMGQRMFSVLGCASCHAMPDAPPLRPAKALTALKADAPDGCLGDKVRRGLPQYHLSSEQRASIAAALKNVAQLATPLEPAQQVARGMAAMNCYACHVRDGVGGPSPQRSEFFTMTAVFDMGDEGRLPPTLAGAGAKLKPDAVEKIVTQGELHVRRHHMATRMPRFPKDRVAGLLDAIKKVDGAEASAKDPPFNESAMRDGRLLTGTKGMGCVNCHGAAGAKSLGMPSVDLSDEYARLQYPWFHKLLLDPSKINPATRMPGFWTDGQIAYPHVAGGTADGQIAAIWAYLSLGKSMPFPAGLRPEGAALELIPIDEPIVHRTFMAEVGPRAIAVGFPDNVHVAFDANTVRLAKAWRGRFFDAKGMWEGRGGAHNGPLGRDAIDLPPGPALAVLASPDALWPRARGRGDRDVGGKFLGYRLDPKGQPVFRYRVGDVEVEEQPLPLLQESGTGLLRRFALSAKEGTAPAGLHLQVAAGAKVEPGKSVGEWRVDDKLIIRVKGADATGAVTRENAGKTQVLIPVKVDAQGKSAFDVEVSW